VTRCTKFFPSSHRVLVSHCTKLKYCPFLPMKTRLRKELLLLFFSLFENNMLNRLQGGHSVSPTVPRLAEIPVLIRRHRVPDFIKFSSFLRILCTGYPLHKVFPRSSHRVLVSHCTKLFLDISVIPLVLHVFVNLGTSSNYLTAGHG
jgi:hypothetical protein